MKTPRRILASLLFSMSAFLLVGAGCGSSSTSTGAGSSTGSTTAGTGGSTGTGSTGSGGSGGSGGSIALTCDAYCQANLAVCTGMNVQWPDMASCMAGCAALPVGTAADQKGNTLGCRIGRTQLAMGAEWLVCSTTGPTGGDGPCGAQCDAFCDIALALCTGLNEQYSNKAQCMSDCQTFKSPLAMPYSAQESVDDTFNCRMYQLSLAASTDGADTHCDKIKGDSPTCTF